EKPEIMAQLSAAIDGIAEACTALGTPITGGNVSLYNETKGVGIYPTPVVGIVGIIDDVTKAVPCGFQRPGDDILVLNAAFDAGEELKNFGSSEYAKTVLNSMWGQPHWLELNFEHNLQRTLQAIAAEGLASSMSDISDGGIGVTYARAALANGIGAEIS